MFVIQREQFASIAAGVRIAAEERIFQLLREHFHPTPVWTSDEAASALVRAAVEKAGAHGMRAARDAFKFAVLMMVFGPAFDEDEPWARGILAERAGRAPVADLLYRAGIERVRQREMESAEPS